MASLFDQHGHQNRKLAVLEAGKAPGTQLVDRQVCVICGWDNTDHVYRCTQAECGKALTQFETDGIENKCARHRTVPVKPVDTY
jgi:hypothetical protein